MVLTSASLSARSFVRSSPLFKSPPPLFPALVRKISISSSPSLQLGLQISRKFFSDINVQFSEAVMARKYAFYNLIKIAGLTDRQGYHLLTYLLYLLTLLRLQVKTVAFN